MASEALNEYIETLAPAGVRDDKTGDCQRTWDPSRIKWEERSGANGAYQRSDDVNSADFQALVKDLQSHKSKLMRDQFFYWLFMDQTSIGRKLKAKK
jgi:hypothetical protein